MKKRNRRESSKRKQRKKESAKTYIGKPIEMKFQLR